MTIERTETAYSYPLLIGSILESGVRKAPEQEIVYAPSTRMTYRDMAARVACLASGLQRIGVRRGDTVAVMDWDSHRYLESFFAVPMMGAVLRHINPRLSPEQILYTINHARDDVILVDADFLPVIKSIWSRVDPGKKIVLISDGVAPAAADAAGGLPIVTDYETLLAEGDPGFVFPGDLDENARATTFYTSGTTGLPKGVYYSHKQLVLHTLASRAALGEAAHCRLTKHDVYMPITPMFHVHAWGVPYVATMLGAKQVYPGRYVPDTLVELIEREKVTFSHCVPTILQMLMASPKFHKGIFDGWKVIIGGAALPRALARKALDHGIDIITGYGMSETCPILTLGHLADGMPLDDLDARADVVCRTGRPIDMVQIRIVDAAMNDVPHDGVSAGEIVVRAPWLTQGYLNDPSASAKLWNGGWLHTGDIAIMLPDGYLKITDRLKDVIKSGGEWISSLDIEDLLLRHPSVSEAAVIGVPDAKWTERPLAVVKPATSTPPSVDELRAHLMGFADKGVISKYGVPERIVFVTELPKTGIGKLDKKLMRDTYGKV